MLTCVCIRRAALACLVALTAVVPAAAEDLSLQQAVDLALIGNPNVAAGRLSAESARQSAVGARALTNPEILVAPSVVGDGGSDSALFFSQPLEINGTRRVRAAIASHEANAAAFDAQIEARDIVLRVRESYWDTAEAQELVKLSQENVAYLETVRAAVEKQKDVGAVPGAQLMKMDVELARARQELTQAELELAQTKASLNALLGRPAGTAFTASDQLKFDEMPLDAASLQAGALTRRPEVAAAQAQVLAARGQISSARLLTAPDVAVQARRETFESESESGVAIAVNLPILDWGSAKAARKSALTTAQSKEKQLEAARNDVLLDVERSVRQVDATARIVCEYQAGILSKSEQLASMARKGYEKGANNYLELLEAQRTLRSTKTDYYSALAEHAKALAQLDWATGGPGGE